MPRYSRHIPLTFSECEDMWERTRNHVAGKPLANNTRLYRRQGGHAPGGFYFAICFHNTDVVEIYSNDTFGVRTNGWTTLTTKQRITSFAPLGWGQLMGKLGEEWSLRVRPTWRDPEPPCGNSIEVEKPYAKPADPGPEPTHDDFGACWAGHRHATNERESRLVDPTREGVTETMRYAPYNDGGDAPNRARAVLTYLNSAYTRFGGYVRVSEIVHTVIDYGEESYRYGTPVKYEQCPNCKALQQRLYRWRAAKRRWDTWHSNMETYGTMAAWKAARTDDWRRVVAANRRWREWDERNRIPLDGLVRINSDGFPLQAEVRTVRSHRHKIRMAESRARRKAEERAKVERQVERLRKKRARRTDFNTVAKDAAELLQDLNQRVVM